MVTAQERLKRWYMEENRRLQGSRSNPWTGPPKWTFVSSQKKYLIGIGNPLADISSQFSPSQERNEGTLAYPENVFASSSQAMKSIVSSSQRPVEKHCINCQQDWHICVSLCWLAVMARQTVALHQFWGMLMSHQSRGCGLGHLCWFCVYILRIQLVLDVHLLVGFLSIYLVDCTTEFGKIKQIRQNKMVYTC